MISGAHMIVFSTDAEADRAFFRDVLSLPSVDAGDGWLIFALPPSEIGIHPASENDKHEISFMCDDIAEAVRTLEKRNVLCEPVADRGWGLVTSISLPGGGKLALYQPKHKRPAGPR